MKRWPVWPSAGFYCWRGAAIFWHGLKSAGEHSYLPNYALYPLLLAVLLKAVLAAMKFKTGRQISSTSLEADAWHDITDLLSTESHWRPWASHSSIRSVSGMPIKSAVF